MIILNAQEQGAKARRGRWSWNSVDEWDPRDRGCVALACVKWPLCTYGILVACRGPAQETDAGSNFMKVENIQVNDPWESSYRGIIEIGISEHW